MQISMVDYLIKVSNGNLVINFLNHIVILGGLLIGFLLWKKSKHQQAFVISHVVLYILTGSVVANAIYYGNPFHLITFSLIILCVLFFQWKEKAWKNLNKECLVIDVNALPVIFIMLGIWYPEFAKVSALKSLLFSPLGVVPCPTLLTLLGFMCLFRIYFNKKSIYTVMIFAFIYGMIGTFVFHVYYDILLLVEVCYFYFKSEVQ